PTAWTSFWLIPAAAEVIDDFAFVNPTLYADHTICCMGFSESIINICSQSMQRKLSLQIPLTPGNFISVQTTGNANLNSLATYAKCTVDGLTHSTTESNTLFQLQRNRLCHQLGIQLWLVNFLNINENFPLGLLSQIQLQLFDLG